MEAPKRDEIRDEPAAAGAAGGRWGGLVAALKQLIEFKDRRIQASVFFAGCGASMVLHGTVPNRAANPEHVLAGYALFTIGAALAFLTLSGAGGLGRAATCVEEALRGYL
ncbi:hypothetical protein BAE44_0018529 [Dichanthelium oligosanthes]|uniref:Uncharacterized protein n=1 Tax=Dichanthelium oligosanthes TaxID=888268 RepID=A0A1E5V5L6_9POAL|nr:hypothetical protein BAE44_0018529 [Dichanthelium oligosanthes]